LSNNDSHFTSTTKVKGTNTQRGGSLGDYRKLAEIVWKWHGVAHVVLCVFLGTDYSA